MTITTLDVSLARLLEPLAPRPELRLAAVRTLTAANLKVGVLATPVMPLINDSKGALEAVCAAAAQAGACSFEAGPLFLKPCSAQVFFPFLERSFPHLARRYRERYSSHPFLRGHYPEMLRDRVHRIAAAHGLTTRQFRRHPAPRFQEPQLELF